MGYRLSDLERSLLPKPSQQILETINNFGVCQQTRVESTKYVNLSSESRQPTQEWQRGVKALLATEGTLVPQRSLKLT